MWLDLFYGQPTDCLPKYDLKKKRAHIFVHTFFIVSIPKLTHHVENHRPLHVVIVHMSLFKSVTRLVRSDQNS